MPAFAHFSESLRLVELVGHEPTAAHNAGWAQRFTIGPPYSTEIVVESKNQERVRFRCRFDNLTAPSNGMKVGEHDKTQNIRTTDHEPDANGWPPRLGGGVLSWLMRCPRQAAPLPRLQRVRRMFRAQAMLPRRQARPLRVRFLPRRALNQPILIPAFRRMAYFPPPLCRCVHPPVATPAQWLR